MNFLNQPYPFYEDSKGILLRLLIISGSIIFVLTVLQPFGTSEFIHPYKNLFLSGYGLIAFLSFAFVFLVLPYLFPVQFSDEKWFVWKQILLFLLGLLITFSSSYLYLNWFFDNPFSLTSLVGFGFSMGAISLIPTVILTTIDYNRQLTKYQAGAKTANAQLPKQTENKTKITLYGENKKEAFSANSDEINFIQAANNYVEIHFTKDNTPQKALLRNSLIDIEKQIFSDSILRCHRSYLVNINNVSKVSGNAQGYRLHFANLEDITVPVSRKKGKDFLAKINKNV